MSPMAIVVDELRRVGEAGELRIRSRPPFPVVELATIALVPLLALPCTKIDYQVTDGEVVTGAHPPTPAQLRVAARRRWEVERCAGLAPHVHCPRCGCGHVPQHRLPARVERPCSCGCHPPRRVHGLHADGSWERGVA